MGQGLICWALDVAWFMRLVGGVFLERFGFSAAPLVLGLILGPIAESNFVTGSLISTAQNGPFVYFFTGGLNILLVSIVILSVGFSIWSEINTKRQS